MKPKAIAEGGLLCAIAVLMACLCTYVPIFVIFYIFIPLPIVVCAQRQGFLTALISSVAASLIVFFLIDWMTALLYAMYFILVGCSLGWTYYKKQKGFIRIGAAYVAILITLIVSLVLLQMTAGVNFVDMLVREMTTIMNDVTKFYESSGLLSAEQFSAFSTAAQGILNNFKLLIPSAFLLAPAIVAWLNILLCDKMLIKLKADIIPFKPLSQWRLPRSLAIFLLFMTVGLSVVELIGKDAVPQIYTYTILEIVEFIYLLMGISFLFWFFNRKYEKEKTGIKILIILVIALISVAASIVSFIGIADIYLHLRELVSMNDNSTGNSSGRKS